MCMGLTIPAKFVVGASELVTSPVSIAGLTVNTAGALADVLKNTLKAPLKLLERSPFKKATWKAISQMYSSDFNRYISHQQKKRQDFAAPVQENDRSKTKRPSKTLGGATHAITGGIALGIMTALDASWRGVRAPFLRVRNLFREKEKRSSIWGPFLKRQKARVAKYKAGFAQLVSKSTTTASSQTPTSQNDFTKKEAELNQREEMLRHHHVQMTQYAEELKKHEQELEKRTQQLAKKEQELEGKAGKGTKPSTEKTTKESLDKKSSEQSKNSEKSKGIKAKNPLEKSKNTNSETSSNTQHNENNKPQENPHTPKKLFSLASNLVKEPKELKEKREHFIQELEKSNGLMDEKNKKLFREYEKKFQESFPGNQQKDAAIALDIYKAGIFTNSKYNSYVNKCHKDALHQLTNYLATDVSSDQKEKYETLKKELMTA